MFLSQPGDRVYVISTPSGGYAEYAVAEETLVGPLPDNMTFSEGAGIGIPCFSAYRALCIK